MRRRCCCSIISKSFGLPTFHSEYGKLGPAVCSAENKDHIQLSAAAM